MDLKLFVLSACLLVGGACAQDNQDYKSHYAGLDDFGVGSSLNSTGSAYQPGSDIQKLIDDAPEGSSIEMPADHYVLAEPLHINKNVTITASPFFVLYAQWASQLLEIDNPKVSVNIEKLVFFRGKGDFGGAITSQAKSLTIKNCWLVDCLAEYGAAIYQNGGNLEIVGSFFELNNASIGGLPSMMMAEI